MDEERLLLRLFEFVNYFHKGKSETITKLRSQDIQCIINFLYFNLRRGLKGNISLMDLLWTIDTHCLLGLELPHKNETIAYLNNLQSEEGTWNTGQTHYVPHTAHTLMFYDRIGAHPKRSLNPFFSKINTWDKVLDHINKYDSDGTNFWGSLWGYVNVYVIYEKQKPPWTFEFLDYAKRNFENWAYDNHQRTHTVTLYYLLCEPIPRLDEVIDITMRQQSPEGGWGFSRKKYDSNIEETAESIWFLRNFHSSLKVSESLHRAMDYVYKNYKVIVYMGKKFGGFSWAINRRLHPKATAFGVFAITGNASPWIRRRIC